MNNTSPSHSSTFFREGDLCPFLPPWPNANFQYLTPDFTLDLICIISICQILSLQKDIRVITHAKPCAQLAHIPADFHLLSHSREELLKCQVQCGLKRRILTRDTPAAVAPPHTRTCGKTERSLHNNALVMLASCTLVRSLYTHLQIHRTACLPYPPSLHP